MNICRAFHLCLRLFSIPNLAHFNQRWTYGSECAVADAHGGENDVYSEDRSGAFSCLWMVEFHTEIPFLRDVLVIGKNTSIGLTRKGGGPWICPRCIPDN